MILVDTSVWIDYFHGKDSAHTAVLDKALREGSVVMGDMIMLEILQGFKKDSDYKQAKKALGELEQFELLGSEMVPICAENYRKLRKSGTTTRQTTDVIIASFCIYNHLPL
ncbi:MAG: PIN domain-containing protein, partial [Pseudomonadales bacterium]